MDQYKVSLLPLDYFEMLSNNSITVCKKTVGPEEYIPKCEIILGVLLLLILNKTYQPVKKAKYEDLKITEKGKLKNWIYLGLFYIISFTIIYPITAIILLIFAVYRQIIKGALKLKLRQNFGGLLDGGDSIWMIEDVSKCVINILLVIKFDEHGGKTFYTTFYEHICEKFGEERYLWKLFCGREKYMGYSYLKKRCIKYSDCLKVLPEVQDRKQLQKIVSQLSNSALPKGHKALWEVYIGTNSIDWNESKTGYPVFFRFHHALGDGIALLKILSKSFDGSQNGNQILEAKYSLGSKPNQNFMVTLKKIAFKLAYFMYSPKILYELTQRRPDCNSLHGKTLSGDKTLVWFTESGAKYVEIVKNVKKRYVGVSFFNVILAAIAKSISIHLKKKTTPIPIKIHTVIPAITESSLELLRENNGEITLRNTITVGELRLPLTPECNNHEENILKIRENMIELATSGELQINDFIIRIFSKVIPEPILRALLKVNSTLIISNVPGSQKVYFLGSPVEDVIFWIPHRFLAGVAFSIFTYDGRFQIGLSVDKALVSTKEEVQEILDTVITSLMPVCTKPLREV